VCFTDDPSGIADGIEIRMLPNDNRFSGWWWKPYLFKCGLFAPTDVNLFFDLDMVIVQSIDAFVSFKSDEFVGMRDVFRSVKPNVYKLGSAVMRWPADTVSDIWSDLDTNPKYLRQFRGDQDWIWYKHKSKINLFPDEWIKSYKWEVRSKSDLRKIQGKWQFSSVANPTIPCDTSVLAFHGSPAVHECRDPIIVQNWC